MIEKVDLSRNKTDLKKMSPQRFEAEGHFRATQTSGCRLLFFLTDFLPFHKLVVGVVLLHWTARQFSFRAV